MNCERICTSEPEIYEPIATKPRFCSVIGQSLRSLFERMGRQRIGAHCVDRNIRDAREEIFLKYGHLMPRI